jgi:hypothetical protein
MDVRRSFALLTSLVGAFSVSGADADLIPLAIDVDILGTSPRGRFGSA